MLTAELLQVRDDVSRTVMHCAAQLGTLAESYPSFCVVDVVDRDDG